MSSPGKSLDYKAAGLTNDTSLRRSTNSKSDPRRPQYPDDTWTRRFGTVGGELLGSGSRNSRRNLAAEEGKDRRMKDYMMN